MVPCGSALLRSTPQCIIQVPTGISFLTVQAPDPLYTQNGPTWPPTLTVHWSGPETVSGPCAEVELTERAAACRRIVTICSSVNRVFLASFLQDADNLTLSEPGLPHGNSFHGARKSNILWSGTGGNVPCQSNCSDMRAPSIAVNSRRRQARHLQYQSVPTPWLAPFLISLGSRASISASEKVISSYC